MRIGLGLGLLAVSLAAMAAPSAHASYERCGEVLSTNSAGGSAELAVRAQQVSCESARYVARKYWHRESLNATIGDTALVKRFKCKYKGYYRPNALAFKCRHTRQKGKALKAYWTPD